MSNSNDRLLSLVDLLAQLRGFRMGCNRLISTGFEHADPIRALRRRWEELKAEADRRGVLVPDDGLDYYPQWEAEHGAR